MEGSKKKLSGNLNWLCLLSTHPVNSVFSVVVRIDKVHVIDEAFFSVPC